MIIINNISDTIFTYNGIEYFKNFMPIVRGGTISIINVYDSKIDLSGAKPFADFVIDGVSYGTIELTQTALLPIVFYRVNAVIREEDVVSTVLEPTIVAGAYIFETNLARDFSITITEATTFTAPTLTNSTSIVFTSDLTGNFAPTFSGFTKDTNSLDYDGTLTNTIQFRCKRLANGTQINRYSIINQN